MALSTTAIESQTGTVILHRVFAAPPDRVYRAFLDAGAMSKWLPPYGFVAHVDHLEPKEGGTFRMSFTNFSTGKAEYFGGTYLTLKPNELLEYNDQFDDPNLPGQMLVRVELKAVSVGTEVSIKQSGIPGVIPVEACYLGWQQSLNQLALVVEPNIPS